MGLGKAGNGLRGIGKVTNTAVSTVGAGVGLVTGGVAGIFSLGASRKKSRNRRQPPSPPTSAAIERAVYRRRGGGRGQADVTRRVRGARGTSAPGLYHESPWRARIKNALRAKFTNNDSADATTYENAEELCA